MTDVPHTLEKPTDFRDLQQVYSYLYRMSEELEVALNSLTSSDITDLSTKVETAITNGVGGAPGTTDLNQQARELKALIINTAYVVESEMQTITQELHGKYVAKSEFGEAAEDYLTTMTYAADGSTVLYNLVENINEYTSHLQGKIRSGWFYDGHGTRRFGIMIGLSIDISEDEPDLAGQTVSIFDSETLEFWIKGSRVAYISNQRLFITRGYFTREIRIGNLAGVIDGNNPKIVRWYVKEDE